MYSHSPASSEGVSPELEQQLADLENLVDLPPARPRGIKSTLKWPLVRFYGARQTHRLVPAGIALWLARLFGRVRWMTSENVRREAIEHVRVIVAGTPRESEVETLARKHVEFRAVHEELFWRWWRFKRASCSGLEHLATVNEREEPVILTSVHLGFTFGLGPATGMRRIICAAADFMFAERVSGYKGIVVRTRYERAHTYGTRYVRAIGSFKLFQALLERGETCLIVLDVPGTMETRMAGKTAYLNGGVARLSFATGAPVVPFFADGIGEPDFYFHEPLYPRDFADAGAMLDRLAELASEHILDRPEQYEANGLAPFIWRDQLPT